MSVSLLITRHPLTLVTKSSLVERDLDGSRFRPAMARITGHVC